MTSSMTTLTALLSRSTTTASLSDLVKVAYSDLHRMASQYFRKEGPGHTLQPTALVNEAFLRLKRSSPIRYTSAEHFFAVMARNMRQTLIDHGRAKRSRKRGGGWKQVPIDNLDAAERDACNPLILAGALARLERLDPPLAEVAKMVAYGGLKTNEVAKSLGIGNSTARKKWHLAKMFLRKEFRDIDQ
jgi:RNA polymerase sigma-70 factor (ECF subfamily)